MSQSILSSSLRLTANLESQRKEQQMISLYTGNNINPKLKSIFKTIKNSFGMVTCIGSQQFYVFTRQMLLHLDFNKALSLPEEQISEPDQYKSEQFQRENMEIEIDSPKHRKQRSIQDDLETSFAKVNSDDIKNIIQTEIYEIESDYELSHNQLAEKEIDVQPFKKTLSSIVHNVSPNLKSQTQSQSQSRESLFPKNQQSPNHLTNQIQPISQNPTLFDRPSPIGKDKSVKLIDESFQKDVQEFKQSMERKKVEEMLRKKGLVRVVRKGEEKFVPKNDFLRVYNCKEIGTDKEKRPIEWIYCQAKDVTPETIQSSYLFSSTVVFELPFIKQPSKAQFQRQIKDYFQFYRKFEAEINRFDDSSFDMPEIIIICPIDDNKNIDTTKADLRALFNQIESFYIPQNKKNMSFYQSPFSQFQKSQSPSKSKLPPTPKRMPITHKASQNPITPQKQKVRLDFRVLSDELSKSGVLRENYSRMREITSQGRQIFNEQFVKTLCGNWVSSGCFVDLVERVSEEVPHVEIQDFYEQWQSVFEDFIKSTMDEAAIKYEQKVNELIVGKAIISQSRLMQIHQVAKKETLRHFSQKKIGSSRVYVQSNKQIKSGARLPSCQNITHSRRISISRKLVQSRKQIFMGESHKDDEPQMSEEELINLVESRIQEQKQFLSCKTKQDAIRWCRKFLSTEYEQIKRKIQYNEIKSLVNFKQQLEFLKENYKKKLENHAALEYEMMEEFSTFMIENTFGGIQTLLDKQKEDWKEKLKKETKKNEDLQVQVKQLKRSLITKERTLSQQKAELENKLQEVQGSIQSMSNELEVRSKEINFLKTQNEEKISQKQNEHTKKIGILRKQVEQVRKQHDIKASDLIYLQSELQKQQLLHQQTHANYEQILITYKNNVSQLERKLKQLKESNSLAQEKMKNSLLRDEIDQQLKKLSQQSNSKIQELERCLQEKTRQMNENRKQYENNLQQALQRAKLSQSQKQQTDLSYKLLQDKMFQIESRLPRYKSNEVQLQKTEKQKDDLMTRIQSVSSEKALIEQKLIFSLEEFQENKNKMIQTWRKESSLLRDQISGLNGKVDELKDANNEMKGRIKELEDVNDSYRKKIYQNKQTSGMQTVFTVDKRQQITIKTKCKHCKENKDKLVEAMKIVQELNENYQSLKTVILKNQCYHCSINKGTSNIGLTNNPSGNNKGSIYS